VLLAALSTGHKLGLGIVAACFIAFALSSSFLAPRRRPDFPGKSGLGVFAIASFVLFAAMISAVEIFGAEGEAKANAKAPAQQAGPAATVRVRESEFKIARAPATVPAAGKVTFVVENAGKIQHDLALEGAGVPASTKTPLISPGQSAKLTVTLAAGTYTLYCTVPGHRAAGMVAKLVVK
jgi:uncharacterized cupredoxin-like copper-binding protein